MLWAGFVPNEVDWNLSLVRKESGYYLPAAMPLWPGIMGSEPDWKTWASSRAEAAFEWRIPDASGDAGFGTSIALRLCCCCCCYSFSALLLVLQFSFYQFLLWTSSFITVHAMIFPLIVPPYPLLKGGQHFQIFDCVQPLELNDPAMLQSWDSWPFTYKL